MRPAPTRAPTSSDAGFLPSSAKFFSATRNPETSKAAGRAWAASFQPSVPPWRRKSLTATFQGLVAGVAPTDEVLKGLEATATGAAAAAWAWPWGAFAVGALPFSHCSTIQRPPVSRSIFAFGLVTTSLPSTTLCATGSICASSSSIAWTEASAALPWFSASLSRFSLSTLSFSS